MANVSTRWLPWLQCCGLDTPHEHVCYGGFGGPAGALAAWAVSILLNWRRGTRTDATYEEND